MGTKQGRVSRLHDFRYSDGDIINYRVLVAVTGLTQGAIQNRLRCYDAPPTDIVAFVTTANTFKPFSDFKAAVSGAEWTAEVEKGKDSRSAKTILEELEIELKEEKVRELKFKNERTEGKYVLLSDVQLALDNFLIGLKTNLEALPTQVSQSMMTCREEHEAQAIMLEALEHLTRDFAENPIHIEEEDAETA